MAFSIKLDEDMPERLAVLLAAERYDVTTVRRQGWQGLEDDVLWSRLEPENRFLITADKGFGDIRKYPPGTHAGILLLRVVRESALNYCTLMSQILATSRLDVFAGCVVVASHGDIRVRRMQPGKCE